MDLSSLNTGSKANEGATLQLRHPTEHTVLEGMTVTLLGADSDKWQKLQRKRSQTNMEHMVKTRTKSLNADAMAKAVVEDLAEITLSWTGGLDDNDNVLPHMMYKGEPLECNAANARKVYGDPGFGWLKEQVDEFINDRSNFL